jgi:hypothetical protein
VRAAQNLSLHQQAPHAVTTRISGGLILSGRVAAERNAAAFSSTNWDVVVCGLSVQSGGFLRIVGTSQHQKGDAVCLLCQMQLNLLTRDD